MVLQHPEVNHRSLVLRTQLPENQPDKRNASNDRKPCYELALKPIILLAFLKNILEARKPDRQQANAKPIRAPAGIWILKRRILQIRTHGEHREQAKRDIHKEHPAPRVVVRNPPAKRRAKRRRNHNPNHEERLNHALLRPWEDLTQRRLRR